MMTDSKVTELVTTNVDDWVDVPDESRSAEVIKDLKVQVESSKQTIKSCTNTISKIQQEFNVVSKEVIRLQKVERDATELKQNFNILEQTCKELKVQILAHKTASLAVSNGNTLSSATPIQTAAIGFPTLEVWPGTVTNFMKWYVLIQPALQAIKIFEEHDQIKLICSLLRKRNHTCVASCSICSEFKAIRERIWRRSTGKSCFHSVKGVMDYLAEEVHGMEIDESY